MKTWEMIKALTENPKLKFRESRGISAIVDQNGILETSNTPSKSLRLIDSLRIQCDEWELVREPVTWQEAIQAWIEGKTIKLVSTAGVVTNQNKAHRLGDIENQHGFNRYDLATGKWYIE